MLYTSSQALSVHDGQGGQRTLEHKEGLLELKVLKAYTAGRCLDIGYEPVNNIGNAKGKNSCSNHNLGRNVAEYEGTTNLHVVELQPFQYCCGA